MMIARKFTSLSPQRILSSWPLVFVLILALGVRIPGLHGSFWLDEAAQALESIRPLALQHRIQGDFQPPLFHYVVHVAAQFSRSEWFLRLPSLFCGLATIVFLYRIGKEHFSFTTAWASALLLALSPAHIFLSQELRPYACAGLCVSASWYFLLTKNLSVGVRWVGFLVATIAGLYTLYIHPFFLLSQLLYVVVEARASLRPAIVMSVIAGLVFLPWFPFFLQQLQVGTTLTRDLPGWSEIVATPQLKALPLTILKLGTGQVYLRDSLVVTLCALLLALLWGIAFFLTARVKHYRYVWYWIILPVLLTWMTSFVVPVIAPKRLLGILPGLWLVCGYLFARLAAQKKALAFALLALVVLINLFFLGVTWITPKYQREPWREIIAQVESLADDHSLSLFAFPTQFAPWDWYSTGKVRPWSTGSIYVTSAEALDERLKPVVLDQKVFFFHYLSDLTDPDRLTVRWLTERSWVLVDQIDGGPLGFVDVFDRMEGR